MEQTANLCAQVPASLLARIREEQEKAGMPRGEYITQILTTYYETQSRKGDKTMEFTKTLAFQIPEELFNRIKDHLLHGLALLIQLGEHIFKADVLRVQPGGGLLDDILGETQPL